MAENQPVYHQLEHSGFQATAVLVNEVITWVAQQQYVSSGGRRKISSSFPQSAS
ncbi:MAG: hypothetical protein M0P70_10555 [Desulfobulbaceae bacterium]|nr:hypothetical protein [Desulfobulbaceae bacterium]